MHRKTISLGLGVLTITACLASMARSEAPANGSLRLTGTRPRVIATTDGEIDDQCSPPPIEGYDFAYPEGRWYGSSALGRKLRKSDGPTADRLMREYYRPIWRWAIAFQNDWAARADWCVADSYGEANHPPLVRVAGSLDRSARPGETIALSASQSRDPDGDALAFKWWRYDEADSATASITIDGAVSSDATFSVPDEPGRTIHIIAEVTDKGTPPLTRYQRIVFSIQ